MALDNAVHAIAGIEGAIATEGREAEFRPPFKFPLSIAISRHGGIEVQPIVQALSRRLGWPSYDRDLIDRVAAEMGAAPSRLRLFDESSVNLFTDFARSFGLNADATHSDYVHKLFQVMWDLASKNHGIFVGRGSAHLLPQQSTLRVLLDAPFEHRVAEAQRRHGYSNADAAKHVRRLDDERANFGRQFLNRDNFDPVRYDLLLNPLRLGDAGAANVIACAVGEMQARTI